MKQLEHLGAEAESSRPYISNHWQVYGKRDGDLRPASLLFDIDTDEHAETSRADDRQLWMSARMFCLPQTRFEEMLLQDVRYYKADLLKEEGQVDIVVLASHLATIGYRVALRTAVGGGTGQNCFRNLCYQFLLVSDGSSPVQHVVDPKFREQFAISQSTEEYEKLLSQIPGEFVGTSTRLRPLVKLLCLKMEQAFQDTGLTRPPWRQPESMLSKWLPSKSQDTQIDSPSSSPRMGGKAVDGKSPSGPLSYCSSRTSSSGGHSPDRLRDVFPRKCSGQSEPRRVQKGFTPSKVSRSHSVPIVNHANFRRPQKSVRMGSGEIVGTGSRNSLLTAGKKTSTRHSECSFGTEWQPRIHTVKMSRAN